MHSAAPISSSPSSLLVFNIHLLCIDYNAIIYNYDDVDDVVDDNVDDDVAK
jgi:hypothetical protein